MEEEKKDTELVTIAGGVELVVTYQNNGASETVKVRQLPVSKIQQFILTMADEAQSIELYCDKPKGWADTLTVESANAVADKGQELNLPFFAAWFRRQMKWRESQQPPPNAGSVKERENIAAASPLVSPLANSVQQSPTTIT